MRILVLILILGSVGCAEYEGTDEVNLKQSCEFDSVYAGEWEDSSLNALILRDDCTGYEQVCDMTFTYYKPVAGQVLIDIESNNSSSSCPDLGETVCNISHGETDSSEFLSVNCGNGNTIYLPQ